MAQEVAREIQGHSFFGKAELTKDRQKYYHLHIPVALANLLRITDDDMVQIYVNTTERQILVRVTSED
jgi:propanediol utilization protein